MSSFLVSFAGILAGGGLAFASIYGLVSSQTAAPDQSPVNTKNVVIEYGANN
jgi:hypothetical protein